MNQKKKKKIATELTTGYIKCLIIKFSNKLYLSLKNPLNVKLSTEHYRYTVYHQCAKER